MSLKRSENTLRVHEPDLRECEGRMEYPEKSG